MPDIIFHVIDLSNDDFRQQIKTVESVLKELELEEKKQLYIFNKIDLVPQLKIDLIKSEFIEKEFIFIESKSKAGIKNLLDYITKKINT